MSLDERMPLSIILHQINFLLTGLCTTLGIQWLFYRGAATSLSLLPQLSSSTGMLLVGLFVPFLLRKKINKALSYKAVVEEEEDTVLESMHVPASPASFDHSERTAVENYPECIVEEEDKANFEVEGPIRHFAIIKLACLDIMAGFTLMIGFSIIGSGMYQVIYSSVVVWCAILTWLFMGRALTWIQWLSIVGVSLGLGVSSFDSLPSFERDGISIESGTDPKLFEGTLMTLGGTFFSACIYVYADNILSKDKVQPLPARVCCWLGFYTSCFIWIWVSVYTLPQFDQIIHIDEHVSTMQVLSVYAIITLSNVLHSLSYYELIERTGNVATGILQGLRAILVYGLSHIWYCSEDSAQCFTLSKGCGSFIVISCVLFFTLGKKKQ